MISRTVAICLSLSLLAAGCDSKLKPPGDNSDAGPDDPDPDAGPDDPVEQIVADISLDGVRNIDILFVIDDSGSMAEEQASLAANFSRVIDVLRNQELGVPNLHIGVTSTTLGAGPFNIQGCTGNGDNGRLLSGTCLPGGETFITDVAGPTGERVTNFTGTLEETFGCMAQLGINGCGFEQTLEAMRRALDGTNPENAGFLRDDAHLAVVFLSDEDDCSAADTSMFDTAQNSLDSELGPLSSFRCFEFGVECTPDDPRTPGAKSNCQPRQDSPFMTPVSEYEAFLRQLKDPSKLVVAAIAGTASPIVVGVSQFSGNPELQPSCISASGEAAPALRLGSLIDAFGARGVTESICNEDLSGAIANVADLVDRTVGSPCLFGPVFDADPAPGIQASCRVFDRAADGTETELPACDSAADPSNLPCHTIEPDAQCSDTESGLAVSAQRDQAPPPETRLVVRCLVEP